MSTLFIGNEDQAFFSCVRLLRDRGIDAHLLLLQNTAAHDHPSHDTFGLEYQAYTRAATWGDRGLITSTSPREIRKYVAHHGFVIGSGVAPAFLQRAGMALDAFIPTGKDLLEAPHLQLVSPRRGAVRSVIEFPRLQADGIAAAAVTVCPPSKLYDAALDALHARGRRTTFPVAPIYPPDVDTLGRYVSRSNTYLDFRAIRERADLTVFCRVPHVWSTNARVTTETLLRGFARTTKQLSSRKLALVLFDVGVDAEAAHRVVDSLGIRESVHFFPRLPRKDILVGAAQSDIVCGNFGAEGSVNPQAVEGIILGKPVLQPKTDARFAHLDASSAESIAESLQSYCESPERYRHEAAEANQWLRTTVITPSIDGFERLIRGAS